MRVISKDNDKISIEFSNEEFRTICAALGQLLLSDALYRGVIAVLKDKLLDLSEDFIGISKNNRDPGTPAVTGRRMGQAFPAACTRDI
jgi:hypothetical protein